MCWLGIVISFSVLWRTETVLSMSPEEIVSVVSRTSPLSLVPMVTLTTACLPASPEEGEYRCGCDQKPQAREPERRNVAERVAHDDVRRAPDEGDDEDHQVAEQHLPSALIQLFISRFLRAALNTLPIIHA